MWVPAIERVLAIAVKQCFDYPMDIQSMLSRELKLPKNKSFFLFGARQSGKTSLIEERFSVEQRHSYNLFLSYDYARLVAQPGLLREEILALDSSITHVFIDEVQRVPSLLNEVQHLLDQRIAQNFILTGSSARKLRRGQANLLAGRAWSYNLYPLTLEELPHTYTLNDILSFGTLPANVTAQKEDRRENLRAYVSVYLKEEIEAEALSRNIGGFIRFLAIAAQTNGEQLNYSNIARDTGISDVTVKEYFKILEDTLLGFFLLPFSFSERKKHKLSPKFYFFDTGVLRATQKRISLDVEATTFEYGNYFESWVINEVQRITSYLRKDLSLSFLRTANDVEVDLVLTFPDETIWGVEIKSKETPVESDFRAGFEALRSVTDKARCMCVCTGKHPRTVGGYEVLPYGEFFELLRSS